MINYDNIAWGIRSPSETYFIECVNAKWLLYNVEQLSQLAPRSIKMYQTVQTKNQNTREYMGYYGIVWTCMRKSSQTKKQKHLYKFERVWRGTGSDAIQDVFHLLAGTNWISLQATWYHDISWWICWYILIYVDIFQKHSLKIDIWYTLAIDVHWVEIDLHKLSWLCVSSRGIESILFISNPTQPDAPFLIHFLHSFARICPDMPRSTCMFTGPDCMQECFGSGPPLWEFHASQHNCAGQGVASSHTVLNSSGHVRKQCFVH